MTVVWCLLAAAFIVGCLGLASNEERANRNMIGHRVGRLLNLIPEVLISVAVVIGFVAGSLL